MRPPKWGVTSPILVTLTSGQWVKESALLVEPGQPSDVKLVRIYTFTILADQVFIKGVLQ